MVKQRGWIRAAGSSLWLVAAVAPLSAQTVGSEPVQTGPPASPHDHQLPRQTLHAEAGKLVDDWELTMRIRAALLADPELSGHNLIVVVRGGLVEIDGPVPNASFRDRVRQIVSRVPGVRQLRERLRIRAEPVPVRLMPRRLPPIDQPWRWDLLTVFRNEPAGGSIPTPGGSANFPQPDPAPVFMKLSLMFPVPNHFGSFAPPIDRTSLDAQPIFSQLQEQLRRQWRFRNVYAQPMGQVIYLSGTVDTSRDLQDLQLLISRVAPTTEVRVDSVRIAQPDSAQSPSVRP